MKGKAMTVDEIEELIVSAGKSLNCEVTLIRDDSGWRAYKKGPSNEDLHDATLPAVIAKLREWATPPKPAMLTIEVPFSWVENRANGGGGLPQYKEQVDSACREALKPWTQS